jgi:hypothetical protein
MKLIAVYGQLANGKDVLCDDLAVELNQKSGEKWERGAFANAVKNTFCSAFDVDRDFIEKWKRIDSPPPGFLLPIRKGLQNIGDGFRQIVPDIWIKIALREARSNNMIISDGRYINEAKSVKENGGINVLIYRDGFLNDDPNPSEAQLRPLIIYARDYLSDGTININNLRNCPEGMQYFDVFIRNETDKNTFLKKSRSILVPLLKSGN